MSEWMDISTAPKDGTEIDLWCRNISHGSDATLRVPGMWWDSEIDRWVDWRDDMLEQKWRPTHWMPLPPPPDHQTGPSSADLVMVPTSQAEGAV